MPRFLRYRFPGDDVAKDNGIDPSPERRARAMAAVFLQIPPGELTPGRLDSTAAMLIDRGSLEWTDGEPVGEQLGPVALAGRRARREAGMARLRPGRDGSDGAEAVNLLRLAIECPCGRKPPLRITEAERERSGDLPPDEVRGTWHCRCGRLHELPAHVYRDAA